MAKNQTITRTLSSIADSLEEAASALHVASMRNQFDRETKAGMLAAHFTLGALSRAIRTSASEDPTP